MIYWRRAINPFGKQMSFFSKFIKKIYLLIIIKDSRVLFYNAINEKLELKKDVTIYEASFLELSDLFEGDSIPKIKILLDTNNESYLEVAIPDIGKVNIKEALRERLSSESENFQILHPILMQKPAEEDPYWRFTVVRVNLNDDAVKFINMLLKKIEKIDSFYLAALENINLCKKLHNLYGYNTISRIKQSKKNHYHIIYLYHSTDYLYEAVFKEGKLFSINSHKIADDDIASYISERATDAYCRISSTCKTDNIDTLMVIPNYLKQHIFYNNRVCILSSIEVAQKLNINNDIDKVIQYSGDLLFSSFAIKHYCKININNLGKINLLQTVYDHSIIPMLFIVILLLMWTNKIDSWHKKEQEFKRTLDNEIQYTKIKHQEELSTLSQRTSILATDPNLQRLHGIIKTNQYYIDTMKLIRLAKTNDVVLENFTYSRIKNITGNSIIIFDVHNNINAVNKEEPSFNHIAEFINNLKDLLPNKEISFYRLTNASQNVDAQKKMLTEVKIIER